MISVTQSIFLIVLILSTCLMAFKFTAKRHYSKKLYCAIALIIKAAIIIFFVTDSRFFLAIILAVLAILFFALQDKTARKIYVIYLTVFLALFTILFFAKIDNAIIFYILLIPLIGLPPFQSWFVALFTSAPFGLIAAFIAFLGTIIYRGESFFKLENLEFIEYSLAILALISSFLAIIQKDVRKLLAYLISSQLAFLAFAHLSNYAQMNLGSLLMTYSFLGASTSFVMLISALEMRRSDLNIFQPDGAYESYPRLTFWLLIFGLISSGLPLSVGYIAEDLIFEGGLKIPYIIDFTWLVAIALNTIIIIKIFLFLCQGASKSARGLDLKKSESAVIALVFLINIFATLFLI